MTVFARLPTITTFESFAGSAGSSGVVLPETSSFLSSTSALSATVRASAWWAGLWISLFVILVHGTSARRVELAGLHPRREQRA